MARSPSWLGMLIAAATAACSNAASLDELPADAGGSHRFTAPYDAVGGIDMLLQTVEELGEVTEIRLTRPIRSSRFLGTPTSWGVVAVPPEPCRKAAPAPTEK